MYGSVLRTGSRNPMTEYGQVVSYSLSNEIARYRITASVMSRHRKSSDSFQLTDCNSASKRYSSEMRSELAPSLRPPVLSSLRVVHLPSDSTRMKSFVAIPSRRLLVVEDVLHLRENVVEVLQGQGMSVVAAGSIEQALATFQRGMFDVVLLDISLHGDDEAGFRLFNHFKGEDPDVGVIFWTDHDQEADELGALLLKPNDYVTKGAGARVLVARINALCANLEHFRAKKRANDQELADLEEDVLKVGDLNIDSPALSASWKGRRLPLSLTQFWMVQDMARHVNEPRSNKDLAEAAKSDLLPNAIAQHIRRIRAAFLMVDPEFESIKTEARHGYRWVLSS